MTQETKLLQAAKDGNAAAFEEIVIKYQSLVCAITFSGTGRVDISEELAQDTFLSAWKNLRQLTDPGGFRPWLCTIARNMLNSYYRKKKPLPLDPADIADRSDPTPSDHLITQEEHVMLEQALMQIPAKYREPLVMYYRQEQSTKEVAIGLGLNESTVRTRLHRARQMLREEIAARLEQTLEKTAPDKTFTKTVMAGIGAGLAAGAAGTATATAAVAGAAGAGAGTTTGIAAVMSTVTAKVITAAAVAAITVGGLITYKHLSQPEPQPTQSDEIAVVSAEQVSLDPLEQNTSDIVVVEHDEEDLTNNQITQIDVSGQESELETQDAISVSSRHPDWPKLDEPIDYIYSKHQDGDQMWVHLPRRFREEDAQKILIDNGRDRINVNKTDNTVQYSDTLTAGETPLYNFEKPLIYNDLIITAKLFRDSLANPGAKQAYSIEKIEQKADRSILVYEVYDEHIDRSKYYVKAFVDAFTLLPEKIVVTNTDPNSEMNGQIADALFFDFAPIPDSIFEYPVKSDEALLARKEAPCFRGMVVDTLDNPVADANVFIHYFPLWGKKYLAGKSDDHGQFEIKIPPMPHEISINLPVFYWATCPNEPDMVGWTVLQSKGDPSFEEMNKLAIGFGGTVTQNNESIETVKVVENGVETYRQQLAPFLRDPVIEDVKLVMEPAATIVGVVTDKQGIPISEARLSAEFQFPYGNYYSPNLNWEFTAATDENGHYEFRGFPVLWKGCNCFVTFSADGYVTERIFTPIHETTDSLELDISLESQLVTISGILTDNYGTALENRSVSVSAPKMSIRNCSAQTDPNGYFVIEGCPDVPGLSVRCSLSSNSGDAYNASEEELATILFYPSITQKIPYAVGQLDYFVELTAIRPETQVEVLVVNSAGKPLADYEVKLDGFMADTTGHKTFNPFPWQHLKLEKRTDKDGRILFDNIPDLLEMKLVVSPNQNFTREMHTLNGKQKEKKRLRKIDEAYSKKYQAMEIPVELVEGQTDYYIEAVVLTKEEFNSLSEESQ